MVLSALGIVLGIVAVGAWLTAVISFAQILRLVPAGQRLKFMVSTRWWQVAKLQAAAGPEAMKFLRRLLLSVAVFIVAVVGGIFVAMLIGMADEEAPGGRLAAHPGAVAVTWA